MDGYRVGAVVRSVRLRLRWRQADVAARAGVSRATVSRIERGLLDGLAVGTLLAVAAALEIRIELRALWRGGELDRMLSAGHSAMHEAVAAEFAGTEWLLVPEASFSIYGERGVIDILAFHPPTGSLLAAELKTDIVDAGHLIGSVDRYRRLAPRIAAERRWEVRSVSCWVVVRDTPTNHRRLAAHATVLRTAFRDDGRRMRAWRAHPTGSVKALGFLSDAGGASPIAASSGVQRVRLRPASVGRSSDPIARSPGDP